MKRSGVMHISVTALSAALLSFAIACGRQPKTDMGDVAQAVGFVPGTPRHQSLAGSGMDDAVGDYANTRFSTLDQINTGNVGSLRLITSNVYEHPSRTRRPARGQQHDVCSHTVSELPHRDRSEESVWTCGHRTSQIRPESDYASRPSCRRALPHRAGDVFRDRRLFRLP